jgi:hypothetical protein
MELARTPQNSRPQKMSPSKLALGVEEKQPMDLAIPKKRAFVTKATRRLKRWPKNVKRRKHGRSSF